jgi:hypothetical protein
MRLRPGWKAPSGTITENLVGERLPNTLADPTTRPLTATATAGTLRLSACTVPRTRAGTNGLAGSTWS